MTKLIKHRNKESNQENLLIIYISQLKKKLYEEIFKIFCFQIDMTKLI